MQEACSGEAERKALTTTTTSVVLNPSDQSPPHDRTTKSEPAV